MKLDEIQNFDELRLNVGGDYWCYKDGTFHDFMVSAQKSADCTGRNQIVHRHASDQLCEGHDHITVTPDPVHSKAVGGNERG